MKTYMICPVTDKSVNENMTRINASLTVLFLLTFGLIQNIFFIVALSIDFYLRSADYAQYSLFAFSSKQIIKVLGLKGASINAGPKIFAARVGFVLSVLIVASYLLKIQILTIGLALILGLFSFLESAFGICVACNIYPFVYKFCTGNLERIKHNIQS